MKRNIIETVLGAVVLLVAAVFLTFSYKTTDVGSSNGYEISADFSSIGGLSVGDPVELSGVKVGTVTKIALAEGTYLAHVTFEIENSIKLPTDTVALISSQSLLGGRYLSLEPGADEDTIAPDGKVQYTQAPQNIEQLLGQFIFSMKDAKDKKEDGDNDADDKTAATSASAPVAQAAPPAEKAPAATETTPSATPAAPATEAAPAAIPSANDHP